MSKEYYGEKCVEEEHLKIIERFMDSDVQMQKEISRLSASLARAHEALEPFSRQYQKYGKHGMLSHQTYVNAVKALHDKDGTHALERWKRVEAVVEAARNYTSVRVVFHGKDPVTSKDYCDKFCFCKVKEAVEALDAKGGA